MIYGAPFAFLKPRQCDGTALREVLLDVVVVVVAVRHGSWQSVRGDGLVGVGDPGCRGYAPSLSVRDVCMRSRPVAIATHTHSHGLSPAIPK